MKSLLYNESDQRCPQQKLPLWVLTLSCTDKYWLPQGPAQVRQVLAKYLTCIKHQGGPYKTKSMALWSNIKVNESPAFTNTGLDYFGPLYVKNETVCSKAWVCIVTCIAMRAMHLELVKVMTVVQEEANRMRLSQIILHDSKWWKMLSILHGKTLPKFLMLSAVLVNV